MCVCVCVPLLLLLLLLQETLLMKQIQRYACLTYGGGSGGTLGVHTIIHEACAALLFSTSPVPRKICPAPTQECLLGAQASQLVWVGVTV